MVGLGPGLSLYKPGIAPAPSPDIGSKSAGSDTLRPVRGRSPRVPTPGGAFLSGKAFCCPLLLNGLEPPSAAPSGLQTTSPGTLACHQYL